MLLYRVLVETNAAVAGVGEIFYGPSLTTMFNAPGLPPPIRRVCSDSAGSAALDNETTTSIPEV
jgi:hypothetical protein